MENDDKDSLNLFDAFVADGDLDRKINETRCLKLLIALLGLKRRRILDGKSQKIVYPVHKICEQEYDDLHLQSEALKLFLLVIENLEEEILRIITYINSQLIRFTNFNLLNLTKLAKILNEVLLICNNAKSRSLFQKNISAAYLDKFLLFTIEGTTTPLRIYILSTVLPNYFNLLDELGQLHLLHKLFLQSKITGNLEVICIIFKFIDKTVLLNSESILASNVFWQHLENRIACGTYTEQKQAVFLLKNCVNIFCDITLPKCEIAYLQVANRSCEQPDKIWQYFFILLDTSKEKQLHLILPSLNLLNFIKHINTLWQVCIYKKLLTHTQHAVVYFTALHILSEKIVSPTLNKHLLYAINKNEYSKYSTKVFRELPNFCNNLKSEEFDLFLENIITITWTPPAAWCLFSNVFSEKLIKTIPFKFVEPIYELLKRLPHIYIRNACISICLNHSINNFNWGINCNETLKFLCILKEYSNDLFLTATSNHIDKKFLNNVLYNIKEISMFDLKIFEILIQMTKTMDCESEMEIILKNIKPCNNKLLVVLYARLYERYDDNDIEKFILDQMNELDENCIDTFLITIEKFMNAHDFSESVYSKVFLILNEPCNYSQTAVFTALFILLKGNIDKDIKKSVAKKLKCYLFEESKTDDNLCIHFLQLYFFTEECPEIPFLQHIIHNHSDAVVCKLFEYISTINFCLNYPDIIGFLNETVDALSHLKKSRHFKMIMFNYINCIFSISLLQRLSDTEMFHVFASVTHTLSSLSEKFPLIDFYLSEKIKSLPELPNKLYFILNPTIEELYLKHTVIKKDERVEYYVCQEIYEKLEELTDNPNTMKTSVKMSSLESILHIIYMNAECADYFTASLMEKYRRYFNKRYFPDSQIHLQKLRIIQILLTIYPFIRSQKETLIDLIVESFCSEVHQPCVKQLMQWLLISLLKIQDDGYFNLIKAKIDTASKTQPSSIVAFIVVLFHLTQSRAEPHWCSTIEAFIPWTMGAHFKLRVYSQAAIKKLIEEARQKKYEHFLTKYSYLEKSITSVIEGTGQAFYDTLKSDELIFSTFNPERDYSLESIFIVIPKLNKVTKTEWENVLQYKFSTDLHIEIINKDKTFKDSTIIKIENDHKEIISEDICESNYNIQRKITPWKTVIEEHEDNKKISDFVLIASLINKSSNLGGLSRTCEVFGVKQLVLNDVKIVHDKDFKSLSMSSEDWIDAIEVKVSELKNYIMEMRKRGYSVIGAEQTSESISLHKYKFNKKTALILGNEKEGIPPDLIPLIDECIEIPQFGLVRSLNVHVAGATFIWEYAKQHLVQ